METTLARSRLSKVLLGTKAGRRAGGGVDGFLRSNFLHQQMSWTMNPAMEYAGLPSRLLFKLARVQRDFRKEGIKGRVIVETALFLRGRLWLVWPGIKEDDTQFSKRDFADRYLVVWIKSGRLQGPCSYGVSEAFGCIAVLTVSQTIRFGLTEKTVEVALGGYCVTLDRLDPLGKASEVPI